MKVPGSRYVTYNVHFEDTCELDAYLKVCMACDDIDLSKMATWMKEIFKKYWVTPEKDEQNDFYYFCFGSSR